MSVRYTATVKLATLAQRRRVVDGLVNLLHHMEAFDSWLTALQVNVGDGTVSITMTKALPKVQLEHLGLNDDGVVSP